MSSTLNATHDGTRRSWIEAANDPAGDFPLQNLPTGVFRTDGHPQRRIGVAIGDQILDLAAASAAGLLTPSVASTCEAPDLNPFLALGPVAWSGLRARLSELLGADTCLSANQRSSVAGCLVPMGTATLLLPAKIGD